jgi:hypothetical protein
MQILTLLRMAPWLAILILLGACIGLKDNRDKWKSNAEAQAQLREADRKSYESAQREAKAKNLAEVARIEAEQERINREAQSDLHSRLELIRRELRQPKAAGGSAGGSSLPKGGEAPCRAADPAWLCLAPEERLRGAENEERHEQLIEWVKRQSEVALSPDRNAKR